MSIDDIVNKLNKKLGEGTITRASEAKALNVKRIPTGSLAIDVVCGGGIPENRISLLVGEESTGKSMLAQKIVANAQEKYKRQVEEGEIDEFKKPVWIDVEGVFDTDWAEALGVDTDNLYVAKPEYGEEALDIADVLVKSRECGLVVLDSIAQLVPKEEMDKGMDEDSMALQARMMNKFLRKTSGAMNKYDMTDERDKPPTVLLLNQFRVDVGVTYGDPRTMPGGRGQKFAPSVTLELRRGDWIKVKEPKIGKDKEVGHWIKVYGKKNKTAPPKRKGEVKFYFKETEKNDKGSFGIVDETVRYGQHYGLIDKNGAWYEMDGEKFHGKDELVEYMRDYPERIKDLRKRIRDIAFRKVDNKDEGQGTDE